MRRFHIVFAVAMVAPACGIGTAQQQQPQAQAQGPSPEVSPLEQKIRDLEDRVVALEGQLRQMKAQGAQPAAPAVAAQPSAAAPQPPPAEQVPDVAQAPTVQEPRLGGAGAAAAKALNPDISMIGDFIASAGHDPAFPTPSFQMHESELGIQAIIDPY